MPDETKTDEPGNKGPLQPQVVNAEDIPKLKLQVTFAIGFAIVCGIATIIGFVFYQYYEIKFAINEANHNIKSANENIEEVSKRVNDLETKSASHSREANYNDMDPKTLWWGPHDCDDLKELIKHLNQQLSNKDCK